MATVMRQCGATEAQIEQARRERGGAGAADPDVVQVWPENWATWEFFLSVSTQWVYASRGLGGSVRVALNYPGIESCARMRRIQPDELERFATGLHVIERAVLDVEQEATTRNAGRSNSRRER